ncbi:hypothetical protein BD410DRAFT_561470 [Rickenella mellea]|uniref:Zn(2)-C6 fungal-type domain-containing protein n=1 Tax=Rickenella mellea TaxID=50990 RepID=A0A4Y7QEB7_9AGAM|nr:hypothetical protein BD410DRAFT_561470 [Rickenella mellea]
MATTSGTSTATTSNQGDNSASSNNDQTAPSSQGGKNSSDEDPVVKVRKRTPMACLFCRGRKLKCDGRSTCSNCHRRSMMCVYEPISKG